jgi:hypothetical protein
LATATSNIARLKASSKTARTPIAKNLRDCQITLEAKKIKFENWILFFLKSLKKQKDNLEKKVKAEKILQENFSELHLEILKVLKNHNRLAVSEI